MLREARTRYGRHQAGYLWALLEPIMHISFFYFIFKFKIPYVPLGSSIFIFLATGFGPYLGFQNVYNRTQGGYASNEALLAFPIVNIMDVFFGRACLELATWCAVILILFSGAIILCGFPMPNSILKMIAAILCLFCIGFGMGVTLGILSQFFPSLSNILKFPFRLLYFASGVFFLPDVLPPSMRSVLVWNPILHAITLFREGYYRGYHSHILDTPYLVGWAIGGLLLALLVETVARKPIRNLP